MNKFPVIETERLILRQLTINDSESMFEIFSSEKVMKYFGMFPYTELYQTMLLINRFNESYELEKGIRWAITLKQNSMLIGTCGYHNISKIHKRGEIGFELHYDYWRKGYITEAVAEIIKFGFSIYNFNRIEALVYPENISSQKTIEKLGFEEEGLLKEYVVFRNVKQDLIMYSLLNTRRNI